ncbi:hypothetical protein RLOC_00009308, partial [Lonchura striata]
MWGIDAEPNGGNVLKRLPVHFLPYVQNILLCHVQKMGRKMIALLCFPSDEIKEYVLSHLKFVLWGLPLGVEVLRFLREALEKFLPPNAHELVSGKLHIILTRLHDWRCVTVSEFASKEELIQ